MTDRVDATDAAAPQSTSGQHAVTTPSQLSRHRDHVRRPQGRPHSGRPAHRVAQARPRRARAARNPWRRSRISACWCRDPPVSARPRWCGGVRRTAPGRTRRPRGRARCAPRTGCSSVASAVATVRDGGGVLLITDIDALLPAVAEPVATLILAELRTAVATDGRRVRRDVGGPRHRRRPAAGTRPVRPRAGPEPARRRDPQGSCSRCCCAVCPPPTSNSTRSPNAHRDSWSPTSPPWCGRPRCGRRRGPARTASRRR